MWIKITPQKMEDGRVEAKRASIGILDTEQLHVQKSDISTVAFTESLAQIRLSSGRIIDTEVPHEIQQLRRLMEIESVEYRQAEKMLLERLPEYMARATASTLAELQENPDDDEEAAKNLFPSVKRTNGFIV